MQRGQPWDTSCLSGGRLYDRCLDASGRGRYEEEEKEELGGEGMEEEEEKAW